MKTIKLVKVTGSLFLLLAIQTIVFGQSNWENRYTIECNNTNYKFEVINEGSCYVVRYFGDSVVKQDTIKQK